MTPRPTMSDSWLTRPRENDVRKVYYVGSALLDSSSSCSSYEKSSLSDRRMVVFGYPERVGCRPATRDHKCRFRRCYAIDEHGRPQDKRGSLSRGQFAGPQPDYPFKERRADH